MKKWQGCHILFFMNMPTRFFIFGIFPLVLGVSPYALRLDLPSGVLKSWTVDSPLIYQVLNYHLSDGLWNFALVNVMIYLWKFKITSLSLIFFVLALGSGILWEFFQSTWPTRSGVDILDCAFSLSGGIIALLINVKAFSKFHSLEFKKRASKK